jgi:hypothetical protein
MTLACTTLAVTSQAQIQEGNKAPQASREGEISVFAGYTNAGPDYGQTRNNGATFGADYTRYMNRFLAPSVEVRFNFADGTTVDQRNFLAGLRLQADVSRMHPYVDALFGVNHLSFDHPFKSTYTSDNAFAKSFGGGINVDVYKNFQANADFQYVLVNFGANGTLPNNAEFTLTPTYATVGVVYRIPSRRPAGH